MEDNYLSESLKSTDLLAMINDNFIYVALKTKFFVSPNHSRRIYIAIAARLNLAILYLYNTFQS